MNFLSTWPCVRRRVLWLASAALFAPSAWAGAQVQEPLADSVRTALSASVADAAPPVPEFDAPDEHMAYLAWLGSMSERLKRRSGDFMVRKEFLQTVWYESRRAGLDPSLVLGLIEVESAFRKFAISHVGARGYMQVMPFWTRQIGDGNASALFHMQTNLRFGCVILRHYLDQENGDVVLALGRYNGSRGQLAYPNAVLSARKHWQYMQAGSIQASR